jgi:hypothetical protein
MKVWKGMEVTYVHVGRAGDKLPSGVMRVVGIVHDTDGTMNRPVEFLMFPTTIGTNTYLNLAPGDGKQLNLLKNKGWKSIEGYVLFKYKIEGDRLLLWKMDPDAKQRVIEDKKVKGEIREGFALDMNRLTDTTENVARFVAKEGDSLFAKEAIHAIQLDRVKSPAASGGVSDAE